MIINIHGFCSSGNGSKSELLKNIYDEVISPDLSNDPQTAIKELEQLIESFSGKSKISLVGTSLGGFYAFYLAVKYDLPCLLINPVVNPEQLRRHLGERVNYDSGEKFLFTENSLNYLKELKKETDYRDKEYINYFIAIGENDELTVEHEVKEYYKYSTVELFPDGHRFSNCFNGLIKDERIQKLLSTRKVY